jgi:hypothetical protein
MNDSISHLSLAASIRSAMLSKALLKMPSYLHHVKHTTFTTETEGEGRERGAAKG